MEKILTFINFLVLDAFTKLFFTLPKRILSVVCTVFVSVWVCCIALPLYVMFGCDVRKALKHLFEELTNEV